TAVSPTQVNLSWTDNATNESGNLIERTTYGGTDWFVIAVTPAGATSYSDPTAEPGTAYQYRVLAFNDVTESSFSNVASVTTVPLAPAGLTATAVSPSQINLSWGDVAGETGYRVERSTDGSTWTLAGTTGANVTTFQDTGRTASTTYQYRIQATNGGGSSSYSNVASARTTVDSSLPAAPPYINVSDPGQLYYRRARLIWIDASNNEDGFQLERSTDGGKSWTRIASVGRDLTRYTDDLTFYYPDGNYSYRVRAFNSSGFSDYSPPNSNLIRIHYPWSYSSWSYSSAPGVRGTGVESSSAGFSGASLAPPIPSNSLPAVQVSTAGVSTTPPSTNSSPSLADSPHARFVDQVIDEWDPLAGPGARRRSLVIMA
ncbi:MAG TPA: fibronectin type III domain-containing protein, partial [Isosphaeraceae bacterium]